MTDRLSGLCLYCFFGAFRMGESLSSEQNSFDPFKAISWSKLWVTAGSHNPNSGLN